MKQLVNALTAIAASWCIGTATLLGTGQASEERESDIEMSPISGSVEQPRRHFRLRSPSRLDPEDAAKYYDIVRGSLADGYSRSGLPVARDYQKWKRYNSAPYLSATHGNHYLSNYANDVASAYGDYENAGNLPVGSVIAKDSFAVTRTGGILLGPLFIMEKMEKGFNYVSGDWRYTLVQPDGTVLGSTKGQGDESVDYCVGCHLAMGHQDHLYFVPEVYRVSTD